MDIRSTEQSSRLPIQTSVTHRKTINMLTASVMDGHQGNNCTYCLIKRQYYWKGMNKDIRKYIANCTLCQHDKAKVQQYPLQMTEIPDRLFNKIAIDLVTDCGTSTSGNKHILTVIDHLTGWPEAFPIMDKSADTIVTTLINQYLPVHMCLRYILSDNGTEFKNTLMDQVLQQLGIDRIFLAPYHPQSNGKLEVFHKYLKPTLKKLCENDPANWGQVHKSSISKLQDNTQFSHSRVTIFFGLWPRPQFTSSTATRTNAMFPGRS